MTSQKQSSQPHSPLYQNKRYKNARIHHFGGCTCQLFSSSVPLSFILFERHSAFFYELERFLTNLSMDWSWAISKAASGSSDMACCQNTLLYGIGSTVLQNIIGLGYALLLNQRLKMKAITRTVIYLPVMISPIAMGYIWYFVFAYQGGALNDVVTLLDLIK